MTTLTVLQLLAALDAGLIECQLGILADALDEAGRSDLAEWCRKVCVRRGGESIIMPHGGVLENWLVFHQDQGILFGEGNCSRSGACAELLRRVRDRIGVRCEGCGWLHELVAVKSLPPRSIECTTCRHGYGFTGLRPEPVPCARCGGLGEVPRYENDRRGRVYLLGSEPCPACQGRGIVEDR